MKSVVFIFYSWVTKLNGDSRQPVSKPKPKGKRAMDMFLEEIKRSVLIFDAHLPHFNESA